MLNKRAKVLEASLSRMTFNEWSSLTDAERETEKQNWHVFEPGYWHALANEAAARFAAEFGSTRQIERVCKSLYRADELIVGVQTAVSDDELLPLPESYLGFRVVQFPNRAPEGVLVDVGPASASSH
jgi:hypothetical protein